MASPWLSGAARFTRAAVLLLAGLLIGGAGAWAFGTPRDDGAPIGIRSDAVSYGTIHRSFLMTPDLYDRGYAGASGSVELQLVSAGIVPHHLLASHQLADFFTALSARERYDVIVLIGPDHLDRSYYRIATSLAAWDTPYGLVEPDQAIVNALVSARVADVDEKIFTIEHSITGLVPFIRRSFPDARFVPITVQASADAESISRLAAVLHEVLPVNSLVLASVDFAHYVPHEEAIRQNGENVSILQLMDPDQVDNLYVDSRPSARAVLDYLKLRGDTKYQLIASTDTAEVIGDYSLAEVTSYITMYFGK